MEPRHTTQLRLGCTPAQWEGQGLSLSVNSPPCLPLKAFSKSSRGYFMLILAAVILGVQMFLVSSEADLSASHWGVFCTSKNTHCTLACIHSPEDSKHFPNTKLWRQGQCPRLQNAKTGKAIQSRLSETAPACWAETTSGIIFCLQFSDFFSTCLLHGARQQRLWSGVKATWYPMLYFCPSSSSEYLNDTHKNKAGDSKTHLDRILQWAPGRQTASTQSSPHFPRLPALHSEQDQDFGSYLQVPKWDLSYKLHCKHFGKIGEMSCP